MENETDMMMLNGSEFSCLVKENLSRTGLSNRTAWMIREDLHYGTPVVATVFMIFFWISFLWNLFIIISFMVKRKLLKEPGNILLLNLAITDFLYAVTTIMFSVVTEIAQEFVFGTNDIVRCRLCDFAGIFFYMLVLVAVHTLAVLSLDRFIHLTKALQYKKIMRKWIVFLIIFCIWVLSLIISLFPIFGFGQYEFNTNFGACLPRFTGENANTGINNYFFVVFTILELLIPMGVLVVTSIWTYKFISKFFKKNLRRRTLYRRDSASTTGDNEEEKKHKKQQIQLVKVFGALLLSNIISWTPFVIVAIIVVFVSAESIPSEIYIFGYIAFLTSPVFHPIIESFFVKDLRYHVTRAKKFIGRGSTYIWRQSTYAFRKKDLDKANARIDAGAETPPRQIRFLKNRDTEMVSLSEDNSTRDTPSPLIGAKTSAAKEPKHLRRKVTFSEDPGEPSQKQRNGALADVAEETPVTCNGLLTPPEVASARVPHAVEDSSEATQRDNATRSSGDKLDVDNPRESGEVARYGTEQEQVGEVTIRIDEC